MREAADHLGMNYSTAKTIVQTFRREKRVAKKPKRLAATKKSIEKEKLLTHFLSHFKVKALISSIIKTELEPKKNAKDTHRLLAETPTASVSLQGNALGIRKALSRVESAGEMLLFGLEEDGPCAGQVSRGVSANVELAHKRPVFFVIADTNVEEEYKQKLDYSNPVLLRNKQMADSQEQVEREEREEKEERFDFREYGERIMERYGESKFECDLKERMLPIPEFVKNTNL